MSGEVYWLGLATQTTASVVYRAPSSGTVAVSCNGQTITTAADTAVDNGIVETTITGLSPGAQYTYAITLDGVPVGGGTLETMPGAGEEWAIAFLSCWRHDVDRGEWVRDAIAAHNPPVKAVVWMGDTPYMDIPFVTETINGVSRLGLSDYIRGRIDSVAAGVIANYDYSDAGEAALITANYYEGQRCFRLTPGVRDIIRRYCNIWQADDHERPGNDANREDFAADELLNTQENIVANATQADEIFSICRAAFSAWYKGNPANNDANNDANFAPSAQTYFRARINDDVELFFIDTSDYKTSASGGKTVRKIIGATQLAWLTAKVAASTATFKVIASPAPLSGVWRTAANEIGAAPQIADGGDTGERDEMMKALDDNTGVIFICGDLHQTHTSEHNGIACVDICPVNSTIATGNNFVDGKLWHRNGVLNGNSGATGNWNGQLGFVNISASRLTVQRFSLHDRASTYTVGYLEPGSNALQYPRANTA